MLEDAPSTEACISFSTAFAIDFNISVKPSMPGNVTIPGFGMCLHGWSGRHVEPSLEENKILIIHVHLECIHIKTFVKFAVVRLQL